MSFKINDRVTWVGKTDWELRSFHGDELSTFKGTSYNSYLIRGEKTALIDTVWRPYAKEFICELKKVIDLKDIDYVIAMHSESDHSGALPELMREIPGTPIYCSPNGMKSIKGHYHEDWNMIEVKTGDKLSLGDRELTFIEARMLHWPDNMMCYMNGENILFSQDAFGQHYCSEFMYNDLVNQSEMYREAEKYYANILSPFSKLVTAKIKEVLGFNLPLSMICPSHGIIWRDNPAQIIEQYLKWADDYQEDRISIIYDTMWDSTRHMAEAIAQGIREISPKTDVRLFNAAHTDKNEIVTEAFKSKAVLLGSATINKGYLSSIACIMEMLKGAGFKKKKAAAFGSYGWSGEAVKLMTEELEKAGFEIVAEGIRETWVPDCDALEKSVEFGRNFASKL